MNEPISATALLLRKERLQIRYKDRKGDFDASIYLDLALNNSLIIEPEDSVHDVCKATLGEDPFLVTFAGSEKPVECYAVKCFLPLRDLRLSRRRLCRDFRVAMMDRRGVGISGIQLNSRAQRRVEIVHATEAF